MRLISAINLIFLRKLEFLVSLKCYWDNNQQLIDCFIEWNVNGITFSDEISKNERRTYTQIMYSTHLPRNSINEYWYMRKEKNGFVNLKKNISWIYFLVVIDSKSGSQSKDSFTSFWRDFSLLSDVSKCQWVQYVCCINCTVQHCIYLFTASLILCVVFLRLKWFTLLFTVVVKWIDCLFIEEILKFDW